MIWVPSIYSVSLVPVVRVHVRVWYLPFWCTFVSENWISADRLETTCRVILDRYQVKILNCSDFRLETVDRSFIDHPLIDLNPITTIGTSLTVNYTPGIPLAVKLQKCYLNCSPPRPPRHFWITSTTTNNPTPHRHNNGKYTCSPYPTGRHAAGVSISIGKVPRSTWYRTRTISTPRVTPIEPKKNGPSSRTSLCWPCASSCLHWIIWPLTKTISDGSKRTAI